MNFEELGVRDDLLRGIADMGFETPMPVQEKVIPVLLHGDHDLVALAQTGTGKTAAFGLPVIQRIDISRHVPQALILSPTRELCLQIAGDLADFSKYIPELEVLPVYGGSSIESQIRALRAGVQIIVATPGRLIDLINRGVVKLADVHTVVLDEADEMLNMGFVDSINDILSHVPDDRKMLMFSATMPTKIQQLASTILTEPKEVKIAVSKPAERVDQSAYICYEGQKEALLKHLFSAGHNKRVIVFSSSKQKVRELTQAMRRAKWKAAEMHSDLDQKAREDVMLDFRAGRVDILIATDILARGIDIDDIAMVVNYDVPREAEDYVHRVGRTARANTDGIAVTFVSERDQQRFGFIERFLGAEVRKAEMPSELGQGPEYEPEQKVREAGRRPGAKGKGHGRRDKAGRDKKKTASPAPPEAKAVDGASTAKPKKRNYRKGHRKPKPESGQS